MDSSKKQQIILLGTFTIDLLTFPIEAILSPFFPVEVQITPYNQVFQELLNPDSSSRRNHDGYANVILLKTEDFLKKHLKSAAQKTPFYFESALANEHVDELIKAIQIASQSCRIPWIICLCPSGESFNHSQHQLEQHIQKYLGHFDNIYLITSDHLSHLYTCPDFYDPISHELGDIPYKYDYFCILGYAIARKIYSIIAKPYKVIILDCDDTLWSGLCGEDGLNGVFIHSYHRQFQKLLLEQAEAGMLLCLCSKNNEEDVKKIFRLHPDMILKLENFVGLKINWQEKSKNIYELSRQLNLSLDCFIFIDDSKMECAEVSAQFPQILTLHLPQEPEKKFDFFRHLWVFDHSKKTTEDYQRTSFYQQEMDRSKLKEQSTSLLDFIKNLELDVQFQAAENKHFPRIAQLIQRCNQFNFNQSSEKKFFSLLNNESAQCYVISVNDRYGEYGESGVILAQKIDNRLCIKEFLLSCRILARGVEHKIVAFLGQMAQNFQSPTLQFNFSKSERNIPAQHFFSNLCQLPEARINKIDESKSTVEIKVKNAVNLSYTSPGFYAEPRSNIKKPSQKESEKVKILARYADQFNLLENLVKTVQSYQKEKQGGVSPKVPYAAPRNPDEVYLQKVFKKVLQIEDIGIDDDFFLLGGSSLMGTLLISEICQFYSTHLTIDLLFKAPTIRKLAKKVIKNKADIHARLQVIPALPRFENQPIPLSFAQQRIWFLDQLYPLSALYNTFIAFQLTGSIDEEAIVKTFNALVERHEIFRTSFLVKSGVPYQIIHPKLTCGFQVEIVNVHGFSDSEIQKKAYEIAQKPFNLSRPPLLRVVLFRHQKERYFLFFCSHHIIIDGHSFNILMKEFSIFYKRYHNNEISLADLTPLQIQYADFSIWQRKQLEGELKQRQLAYWTRQLLDLTPLDFPTDFMRSEKTGIQGKRIPFHFDQSLLDNVHTLSHRAKVTVFTILLSAYAVLLSKYTGKKDIVIGIPVAGRQYPGVENMIGHFVNILIIRLNLAGNDDFLTLLIRNHQTIMDAYAHQDLPFEELVQHLNPDRNIDEHPLAQVMMVFQESDLKSINLPDIQVVKTFSDNDQLLLLADYDHSKLDITMDIQVTSIGIEGLIEYNSHLFSETTIAGMVRHFHNILVNICKNPQNSLSAISIFDEDEYKKILLEWNQTMTCYPSHITLAQLIEEQAKMRPDHIAIWFYDQQLTYYLLNQRANQLAYYLQTKNVRPQMLIALFLNRSIDLVIAILAIFKLGAAYVPLSPDLPKEHIKFLLEDSQASFILTQKSLIPQANECFHDLTSLNILAVDELELLDPTHPNSAMDINLLSRVTPHHIAAMIYTSGSTGQPKGVLIKQQGLINTAYSQINYLNINSNSRVMQVASINFDAALWDILGALIAGATLYLVHQEDILNTHQFVKILQEQRISLMTVTPSYLNTLPKIDLPELQTLVVAGEPCSLALVKFWAEGRRLVNAYGTTEASICTTMSTLTPHDKIITIGRPIANTQVYVLNPELQPVPIGIPGELYIAGDGVAQGYHHHSDWNKQNFLPNPFSSEPNAKIYKTGDQVRWLANGDLEYLGRNDDRVKIRGIRTELGAITQALQEHPLVSQATVIFKHNSEDDQKLIAYIILQKQNDAENKCILNHQHITHWQKLYNNLYATETKAPTLEGWESSYTNQPISEAEMEEWIQNTTARILALSPNKLLEIGCGSGLLVQHVAPFCNEYVATDFSEYALNTLKSYCNSHTSLQHVRVEKRAAHEFSTHEKNSCDTIVLNSIIQYFPNIDYLITVLNQCIAMIDSTGQIYIGDVRNLNYQSALHSDIQYYKLKKNHQLENLSFTQWQQQVQTKIIQDPELVVSPDFFHWYAKHNPKITHVSIELRRGIHHNEMNCFRYDVILHIAKPTFSHDDAIHLNHYDWKNDHFDLQKVQKELKKTRGHHFVIHNVPNKRVNRALFLKNIRSSQTHQSALSIIEERLHAFLDQGIDPEIFWRLGEKYACDTLITFSQEQENCMDIIFIRKNNVEAPANVLNYIKTAIPSKKTYAENDYELYANSPMNVTTSKLLTKKMQEFLRSRLPSHMIPTVFITLDKMPLTANGKIDKSALPDADFLLTQIHHQPQAVNESSPEGKLRKIFSELLNLPADQIHDQDSFFDIGGHSLLAIKLVKDIEEAFDIQFTIRDLFKTSSINEIIEIVQKQNLPSHELESNTI